MNRYSSKTKPSLPVKGTGHKFKRDDSTTKAVLKRMESLGVDIT